MAPDGGESGQVIVIRDRLIARLLGLPIVVILVSWYLWNLVSNRSKSFHAAL